MPHSGRASDVRRLKIYSKFIRLVSVRFATACLLGLGVELGANPVQGAAAGCLEQVRTGRQVVVVNRMEYTTPRELLKLRTQYLFTDYFVYSVV